MNDNLNSYSISNFQLGLAVFELAPIISQLPLDFYPLFWIKQWIPTYLKVSEVGMAKDIQMNIISYLAISGVHAGAPSSGAVLFCAINIDELKQFLP